MVQLPTTRKGTGREGKEGGREERKDKVEEEG